MGSKKLKAIAVRGKAKIPMHDPEKFREVARGAMEEVKTGFISQVMHDTGTAGWVDSGISYGDTPTKYYTTVTMPEATEISGVTQNEKYQVGNTACFGCPIGCRKVLHIKEGPYKTEEPIEGPEYETLIAWGPLLLIADMGAINHMNTLVNGFGMDSISSGASAAYAFYLYEKGVITSKDTGGCMGLVYATSNRGADHNKSDAYLVENGMGNPDLNLIPGDRFGDDKAPMVVLSQDWRAITDALGICHFAMMSTQSIIDAGHDMQAGSHSRG